MDYIKYVDEVAKEKSQYTFPDTLTGIEQLANDDYTILHTLDVLLRGTYLENPFAFPDIKLFGKTRPVLLLRHIWFMTFQRYWLHISFLFMYILTLNSQIEEHVCFNFSDSSFHPLIHLSIK